MKLPQYDIFSGCADKDALWIETVEGLGNAYDLMTKIAAESPGRYFVFCPRSHAIRGSINTLGRPEPLSLDGEDYQQSA
jgi:hypothetical protein